MTITSKPYTEAYAEGWERIFGPEWSPPKATRNVEVDEGVEWMPVPPPGPREAEFLEIYKEWQEKVCSSAMKLFGDAP